MLAKVALAALIVAATFLAPANDGHAQEWVAPGPDEGASFPDVLHAPDQTGRDRTLEDLMGRTGLVVAFVRSADWCPFCMKQLVDLQSRTAQFEELGLNVATVSVDSVELVKKFADAQRITFVMLADPTGAINERLGIRDAQYPVGSSAFGVPQPGIFVLNRDRKIVGKYFVQGYRDRPDLDAILTGLRTRLKSRATSAGQSK
jgi:peroxiredoxin